MKEEITVPSLGESVTSGILTAWLKTSGDYVKEGENLFELESDKATVEVPSTASGVLEVLVEGEAEVEVGQVVAAVDTSQEAPADRTEGQAQSPADDSARQAPQQTPVGAPAPQQPPPSTPLAEKTMQSYGISPADVQPTGEGGRITKEDVMRAVQDAGAEAGRRGPDARVGGAGEAGAGRGSAGAGSAARKAPGSGGEAGEKSGGREAQQRQERVRMSRIRERIAENLVRAKQNAAHLTTFNEIDMHRVIDIRKQFQDSFVETHGIKLGFLSFFIKASCIALEQYPEVNTYIEGKEIVYNRFFNIGIAVSTERGLVVPVVKNADTLELDGLEKEVARLAEGARTKQLTVDEMSGGTFSITNGGVFGSLLSTPIPTPPQTAILGMHAIKERPVAEEGNAVIRPMMYVALTYDHRVIDGREAVGFLSLIKSLVETPEKMFLNIKK
jgi:2-oxoglutarate dehydrogenase E2 component (dihydrolipoamide succinyltransferase)